MVRLSAVGFGLVPRPPHGCHRLLSIMPMSGAFTVGLVIISSTLVPASTNCTGAPGSTGLWAHPGQRSLPP